MDHSAFSQSRDGFFVFLVWIALIIIVLKDPMLGGENPKLLAVVLAGGIACCIPTLMYYKNIKTPYIKYISATLLPLISLYALTQQFNLFNLILLYLNLIFLSLYANHRLLIYNGILVSAVTIGIFMLNRPHPMLLHKGMLPLLIGVILTTAALSINSRRMEKLTEALALQKRTSEQLQSKTHNAAEDLQSTVNLLYNWSLELEQELQHTARICKDISASLDSVNTSLDIRAETAASQETEVSGSGFQFEADLNFLCNPDSSLQTSAYPPTPHHTSAMPDLRERVLRITAKILHLAEHAEVNKQKIEDIKAGLSHQHCQLSDLIQVNQCPSPPSSKPQPTQKI